MSGCGRRRLPSRIADALTPFHRYTRRQLTAERAARFESRSGLAWVTAFGIDPGPAYSQSCAFCNQTHRDPKRAWRRLAGQFITCMCSDQHDCTIHQALLIVESHPTPRKWQSLGHCAGAVSSSWVNGGRPQRSGLNSSRLLSTSSACAASAASSCGSGTITTGLRRADRGLGLCYGTCSARLVRHALHARADRHLEAAHPSAGCMHCLTREVICKRAEGGHTSPKQPYASGRHKHRCVMERWGELGLWGDVLLCAPKRLRGQGGSTVDWATQLPTAATAVGRAAHMPAAFAATTPVGASSKTRHSDGAAGGENPVAAAR